jgi:hypothetical protein
MGKKWHLWVLRFTAEVASKNGSWMDVYLVDHLWVLRFTASIASKNGSWMDVYLVDQEAGSFELAWVGGRGDFCHPLVHGPHFSVPRDGILLCGRNRRATEKN